MTLLAYEAQESWLPTVTGMTCNSMQVEDDMLLIHFGPPNTDSTERTIALHGTWRAELGDEVIAGSGDIDPDHVPETLHHLVGSSLQRTEVDRPGFDLALHFSGGMVVRCFPCESTQFAADSPDDDDHLPVSWWVEGDDIPVDWETFNDT